MVSGCHTQNLKSDAAAQQSDLIGDEQAAVNAPESLKNARFLPQTALKERITESVG
jgi:hypothetical protein